MNGLMMATQTSKGRWRWLLAFLVALPPALYGGCELLLQTSHSFRITLHMEVDGEPRVASNVYRTTVLKFLSLDGWLLDVKTEGDAIYLNLGQGRHVFMLMAQGREGSHAEFNRLAHITFTPRPHQNTLDGFRSLTRLRAKVELPPEKMPVLATLGDMNDLKSLVRLDAAELSEHFGGTVRFKRCFIEMTKDPVTRGIERVLPWLREAKRAEKQLVLYPPALYFKSGTLRPISGLFTRG